jgi:hypothetical protein
MPINVKTVQYGDQAYQNDASHDEALREIEKLWTAAEGKRRRAA